MNNCRAEELMEESMLNRAKARFKNEPSNFMDHRQWPQINIENSIMSDMMEQRAIVRAIENLVKQIPNDSELGAKVREYINNLK